MRPWSPRQILLATVTVGAVALGFVALYTFRNVLFLLFIAIVLATAIKPLVERLERRGIRHGPAVAGVYSVVAVLLLGAVSVGGPLLADQAAAFVSSLPEKYAEFRQHLEAISSPFVAKLAASLPRNLAGSQEAGGVVEQAFQEGGLAVEYLRTAAGGAVALAAAVLLSFYWSLQRNRTLLWALLLFPPARRDAASELYEAMEGKVGAYIRGQGILCLVVALMSLAAYWLIGLPHAIVLALLAGLLEAVPFFGPVLGAIPPLVTALSMGTGTTIATLAAAILIQQAENYVLVPRVMGKSVGVNPLVTLLAIAGFTALLGLVGAILAIPMAAVIQLLLDRYLLSPKAMEPEEPEGRDTLSLIQYQARQLAQDVRLRSRDKPEPATSASDRVEDIIEGIARDLDLALALEKDGGTEEASGGHNGQPAAKEDR